MCTGGLKVDQARICYGGVAPKCLMATNTQAALEGQPWTQATLDAALLAVAKDVNITPDAPGVILPALLLHAAPYSVLNGTHSVWYVSSGQLCCTATCVPTAVCVHLPGIARLPVLQSNLKHSWSACVASQSSTLSLLLVCCQFCQRRIKQGSCPRHVTQLCLPPSSYCHLHC